MRKEGCYECHGVFVIEDNERILCLNCERDSETGEPCNWSMKARKEVCKRCGHTAHVCILPSA